MALRLNGSTSGYSEIDAPAVAGSNTLVLPTGNGSADQVLTGNGSGALSWSDRGRMTLATSQAATSGTEKDFTGIPSWVKHITVMLSGVSTSGSADLLVQIGAGSVTTSGYISTTVQSSTASGTGGTSSTAGFILRSASAANVVSAHMTLITLGSNIWVASHVGKLSTVLTVHGGGDITLGGTLDRVRVTTTNGTDTFDAGTINILYEG